MSARKDSWPPVNDPLQANDLEPADTAVIGMFAIEPLHDARYCRLYERLLRRCALRAGKACRLRTANCWGSGFVRRCAWNLYGLIVLRLEAWLELALTPSEEDCFEEAGGGIQMLHVVACGLCSGEDVWTSLLQVRPYVRSESHPSRPDGFEGFGGSTLAYAARVPNSTRTSVAPASFRFSRAVLYDYTRHLASPLTTLLKLRLRAAHKQWGHTCACAWEGIVAASAADQPLFVQRRTLHSCLQKRHSVKGEDLQCQSRWGNLRRSIEMSCVFEHGISHPLSPNLPKPPTSLVV